jgi:hypothetical protein
LCNLPLLRITACPRSDNEWAHCGLGGLLLFAKKGSELEQRCRQFTLPTHRECDTITLKIAGHLLFNSSATPSVQTFSKRECTSISGKIYTQLWSGHVTPCTTCPHALPRTCPHTCPKRMAPHTCPTCPHVPPCTCLQIRAPHPHTRGAIYSHVLSTWSVANAARVLTFRVFCAAFGVSPRRP